MSGCADLEGLPGDAHGLMVPVTSNASGNGRSRTGRRFASALILHFLGDGSRPFLSLPASEEQGLWASTQRFSTIFFSPGIDNGRVIARGMVIALKVEG
jgi:hypothetical protein